ncbi:MAG: fibronectin type III domain-containing protein [Bacteroidetes bacterium]|nr:fibronectin type III domain-containing protein [Bacteroidota bacterium]
MKANIKLSLSKLRPVVVLALMRNTVAKMTGNADFTTPLVPLADMTTLADDLEQAIEAATNGSRTSKLARNKVLGGCKVALHAQADYVRSVCNGDAAKLAGSGFELAKQPTPIGIPGTAQKMEARITGLQGQLELRWHRVYGARGYQVWMTDQDPAMGKNWQAVGYTTRATHLVTELEPYKAYWFCVSAIGTAGEGAQCDPALGRAA